MEVEDVLAESAKPKDTLYCVKEGSMTPYSSLVFLNPPRTMSLRRNRRISAPSQSPVVTFMSAS